MSAYTPGSASTPSSADHDGTRRTPTDEPPPNLSASGTGADPPGSADPAVPSGPAPDRISVIVSRVISGRDTAASCSASLAVNSSICPRSSEIPSLARASRRSRAVPSRLRQAGLPHRLGAPHRHLPTRRDQPTLEGDPAGRPAGPLCVLSPRRLPGLHRPALLHRQRRQQGAPPHLDAAPTARGPKPGPRRTGNALLVGPLRDARGLRGHRLRDRPRPRPGPLPLSEAGEGARPTRPHRRRHQHRPSQRVLPSQHRTPSPSPTCHPVPTALPEHRTPAQQLIKRRSPTASRDRGRSCRGRFQGNPGNLLRSGESSPYRGPEQGPGAISDCVHDVDADVTVAPTNELDSPKGARRHA
jgi:hypothetical protein